MSVQISNPDARTSVKLSNGASLHLPHDQAAASGPRVVDTVKILPAVTSSASFGNFIDLAINPGDIDILSAAWLVLNLGQLTTTGTNTGSCFVNDARFFLQHYDVILPDGTTAETYYPDSGYIRSLLFESAEIKARMYPGIGNASITARGTANGSSGQTVYIPLYGFWSAGRGFLTRSLNGPIRIRCYLEQLSNLVNVATGSATAAACTINSSFLYVKGVDFSQNQQALQSLILHNRKLGATHNMFNTPVQMVKQVLNSGTTTYSISLSSFIGNFSSLAFVVRTSAHVNTAFANAFDTYASVASYALKTSNGTIVNGTTYPDGFVQNILLPQYFKGDATDSSSATPKSVYVIPFAGKPQDAVEKGHQSGSFAMSGFEQLQITFASALAAAAVVDVIGWQYKYIQVDSAGGVKILNA